MKAEVSFKEKVEPEEEEQRSEGRSSIASWEEYSERSLKTGTKKKKKKKKKKRPAPDVS